MCNWSDRALVPEQFGLGGLESVRGYRQDLLLTDNGALLLRRCGWFCGIPVRWCLTGCPFVDVGTTWNSSVELIQTVTPWRLSVSVCDGNRAIASRLVLIGAFHLVDVDSTERTWQENGVYFSVLYNPLKALLSGRSWTALLALITAFLCTVVSPVVAKLHSTLCPKSDKRTDQTKPSATGQNTL